MACADPISLDQFGGKADGTTDDGPAFTRALAYAQGHPGTTLRLGGVCRIATPQIVEQVPKGERKMGAGGMDITNLIITDGTVLLRGPFGGFKFDHCPGITFRNVIFDHDPPILSQGRVVTSDLAKHSMTVVPDPGYPSPADPIFGKRNWLTVHQPNGDYAYFFVAYPKAAVPGANGEVTLTYDRADFGHAIEGRTDLRYAYVQRAFGNMLTFHYCDGARLENCTFYATSDFASLFLACNDVVLTGNKICPKPGSGRIVSTSADGFHFIAAQRGPRIENNFFDRMQDDNIVISLRGNKIKSHAGTQLQLTAQSCSWYHPGDTIEVITPTDGVHREYKIVAMLPQKNDFLPPPLTLDRPLEGNIVDFGGEFPTLVYNKSWRLDGTVIRHNIFQNTRRYAVFMGAGGVTIEDNTMSNFTGAALLLGYTENLQSGKGELCYYPSADVTVRGNTISHAFDNGEEGRDFSRDDDGAIEMFDASPERLQIDGLPWFHHLDIENNTITDSGGPGIVVSNADGVTIKGNTVTRSNLHKTAQRYGILVRSTANLTQESNNVQGPNLDAPVQVEP